MFFLVIQSCSAICSVLEICRKAFVFGSSLLKSCHFQSYTMMSLIGLHLSFILFYFILFFWLANRYFILFIFFPFIFISWRLITLQYCSGFCHTLTWGSGWGPHVNVSFFYIFYQITWFGYFDWITNYSCLLTT